MPAARLAASAALSLVMLCVPDAPAQVMAETALVVWVDAGNGADTPGRWALGLPYNTLNYALDQVWDLRHPDGEALPGNPVEIRIAASSAPIAPVVSGGFESDGWAPGPGMRVGEPFPLRMMNGVSVVGTSRSARAVITLDGNYVMPPGDQAAVIGASHCRLVNLELDGSGFVSSGAFAYRGVMVGAAMDFQLIDCFVHDWHDQLWMDSGAGNTSRVAAFGSTFSGAWPPLPTPSEGHALVRVASSGTVDLTLDGCVLRDTHDGLEVGATTDAPHFIAVRNTLFELCENSLEASGVGAAVMVVEDCVFRKGGSRPGGQGGVGGVGARGAADIDITLRRCSFIDNSRGVNWDMLSPGAVLDMGRDDDPGLNGFCFSSEKCERDNILRVAVQQFSSPGNVILASGNFWLPANQGARSSLIGGPPGYDERCYTLGMITGPVNYTACPAQCPQGAPFAQEGCDAAVVDRNYSIKHPGAGIDFGTLLPPSDGFLPPPCMVCGCLL